MLFNVWCQIKQWKKGVAVSKTPPKAFRVSGRNSRQKSKLRVEFCHPLGAWGCCIQRWRRGTTRDQPNSCRFPLQRVRSFTSKKGRRRWRNERYVIRGLVEFGVYSMGLLYSTYRSTFKRKHRGEWNELLFHGVVWEIHKFLARRNLPLIFQNYQYRKWISEGLLCVPSLNTIFYSQGCAWHIRLHLSSRNSSFQQIGVWFWAFSSRISTHQELRLRCMYQADAFL